MCSDAPKLSEPACTRTAARRFVLFPASPTHSTYHQRPPTGNPNDLSTVSAADCANHSLTAFCFIAAAHCHRTVPSNGSILCQLPYRNRTAYPVLSGCRWHHNRKPSRAECHTERNAREPSPMIGMICEESIGLTHPFRI